MLTSIERSLRRTSLSAEERKLNAEERKLNVEQRNIDSQLIWRPWQVALIPILLGVLALVAAIAR